MKFQHKQLFQRTKPLELDDLPEDHRRGYAENEIRPRGDYQKLSEFISPWPTLSIFRRFGALNVQNILLLQSELAYLEDNLQRIRMKEEKSSQGQSGPRYAQSFYELARPLENGQKSPQYQKVLQIRETLKEYNAALNSYHEICKMPSPRKYALEVLRYWLHHPRGGDQFLRDVEVEAWSRKGDEMRDLVAMSNLHQDKGALTTFISDCLLDWFSRITTFLKDVGSREYAQNQKRLQRLMHMHKNKSKPEDLEHAGIVYCEDVILVAILRAVGALLASLLPPLSIFVLYYVKAQIARLCIILGFSAIFSFSLSFFTKARVGEIFAGAAAFASVQVVFIGTN